jgi:vancomycin aglycone glucosyltransferase
MSNLLWRLRHLKGAAGCRPTFQVETLTSAAQDCDVIVVATAPQVATRIGGGEVGDSLGLRRLCAVVLPSPHHAPPP